MFTKTVEEAHGFLPGTVKSVLGIEPEPRIASAEDAAFELARRSRGKVSPLLQSSELSTPPDNDAPAIPEKE
jgi:hypothetical protein